MTRIARERESYVQTQAPTRRLFLAAGSAAAVFGSLTASAAEGAHKTAQIRDPVLAALKVYDRARADAQIAGDTHAQIERRIMGGLILDDRELDAAEARWHDAVDRRDDASSMVLRAAPATEEGAVELARFAKTMTEQFAHGCNDDDLHDIGVACQTLGDWLIARPRTRAEV